MAVNEKQESMAVHVLAHLAIKNLHRRVWTREDVEAWLLGMDGESEKNVRNKMNSILKNE
jgi:hypothetical protein